MEPIRRRALIEATISEIGAQGSLDVTVSQIAKRAGVSSALAHHYFGAKDQIFLAAMRYILSVYAEVVAKELAISTTPLSRVEGIVRASMHERHFEAPVIAAWLAFYVQAQKEPEVQRLLRVYAKRLHSNLVYGLKSLVDAEQAERIAHGTAALIDGFYIRHALREPAPSQTETINMIIAYIHQNIEGRSHHAGTA